MVKISIEKLHIPPIGNHLLVKIHINSVESMFVVDTGASRSVIDVNYLKQIDENILLNVEEDKSAGVGSSNLQAYTASLREFRLGDLRINDFQIAAMDLSHVIDSYIKIGCQPIYGVLGGEVLSDYNAVINYRKECIYLDELSTPDN